jgi:predicted nucleotidyltransferase
MPGVQILSGPPRFALDDIRRVVLRACAREGAHKAILFGSYARGEADAFSDLDLVIVCDTSTPFLDRFRSFVDVLDAFPGTDLLVYTPAEYEGMRRGSGFVERAEREGMVLFDATRAK